MFMEAEASARAASRARSPWEIGSLERVVDENKSGWLISSDSTGSVSEQRPYAVEPGPVSR
jgi:hypothetical protein